MSEDLKYRDFLNQSFSDWDADMPKDGWDDLVSDLRVEQQWKRLNHSLDEVKDANTLAESFHGWDAGNHLDGWSRIDEELSRERVWNKLHVSLDQVQINSFPWLKYIASCAAAILISFFLPVQEIASKEFYSSDKVEAQLVHDDVKSKQVDHLIQNAILLEEPVNRAHGNRVLTEVMDEQKNQQTYGLSAVNYVANFLQSDLQQSTGIPELLNPKDIAGFNLSLPADRDPLLFPIMNPSSYYVRVGTQLAVLNEKEGSPFNNFFPRAAWTFDIGYTKRTSSLELSVAIGMTQFAQESGKYINGRYFNSSQKLNTMQVSATVGKDLGRWTVYGGVQVNKLIFGIEERSNMVTNIYNSNTWNLGATAGIDVLLNQFNNGDHIDFGAQYQYIPHMKSSNAVFNDIQGLKFQLKYAF
jgi:hypothetical protein